MSIVTFREPLYRVDALGNRGMRANYLYGRYNKYFALTPRDTAPYQRHSSNVLFILEWLPTEDLELLDLFDLPTRNRIYAVAPPEVQASMDISFPVRDGVVRRYSDTTADDNRCLDFFCLLGADGYITKQREEANVFHSEVGVCSFALHKLVLQGKQRSTELPRMNVVRTQARNRNNTIRRTLFGASRKSRRIRSTRRSYRG